MLPITANVGTKDGAVSVILNAEPILIHFDFKKEAVQNPEILKAGMGAFHGVIWALSGEKAADYALQMLLEKIAGLPK